MSVRDSSSSEDENKERIKEAVWSFTNNTHEDGGKHTHKRSNVYEHDHHDGNELKTTPEFRTHIAKKLAVILDSVICEVFRETPVGTSVECVNSQEEAEADDGGFRLFSTSHPGNWREEPKQTPSPKRGPAPSSSDSDSEMESRLREAAVSISDLLPSSSAEKQQEDERMDAGMRDENTKLMKKKKKKKRKVMIERDEEMKGDRAGSQGQSGENNTLKKKKKKNE